MRPVSGGSASSAVPYAEAWRQTDADVILFEIEDSVPAPKKSAVRQHVVEVAGRGNFAPHQRKMVTVNRLDTKWGHDDLVAMASAHVNGVVLAKCESPEDVRAASDILDAAGAPPDMEIWAMIETPRGRDPKIIFSVALYDRDGQRSRLQLRSRAAYQCCLHILTA